MQFLTPEQKETYLENGFLIIDNFVSHNICALLMARAQQLIEQFTLPDKKVIFSTVDQQHAEQQYFLESGDKIHFFFEQNANLKENQSP